MAHKRMDQMSTHANIPNKHLQILLNYIIEYLDLNLGIKHVYIKFEPLTKQTQIVVVISLRTYQPHF